MIDFYCRASLVSFIILCVRLSGSGQNIISEMDHDARHVYDRMIILSEHTPEKLHTSIFPYWRSDLVALADAFGLEFGSPIHLHQTQTIYDQNNEFLQRGVVTERIEYADSTKTFRFAIDSTYNSPYRESRRPLWRTFYKTPAHLFEVNVPDFYLRVNPMIRIALGRETEEDVYTFINQRGLSIRGGIGQSVYFYTSLYDSQIRFPNYVNNLTDELGVVPGAGFYKNYESNFFDIKQGRDFLLANAYVGVNLGKYIGFQFGHNQHFIGDGIRSLFLSDFSTPFFSLKINTRIWKLHYQNIFAELAADNFQDALNRGTPVPKKYMAAHYLSFRPNEKFSVGLFETVVFDRNDGSFELQYLNPIILYRSVEGSIGSPDNVMLGLNARWDFKNTFSFYSQFLIDDLQIKEVLKGRIGWWGNKIGYQLGAKYINAVGIDNLDVQVEWNQVRPYTYSHYDEDANYSHYKQPLAHPLGANFNEWIASVRYQATPRLVLQSSAFIVNKGEDPNDSLSYGGNIIVPNVLRPGDYDHKISQGVQTDLFFWTSTITYEISSGLFADLQYLYRTKTSGLPERDQQTNLFQAGIRLNMARREEIF